MEWIVLSLLSALTCSTYSIIQKYALERRVRSVFAFSLWGATLHLGVGIFISSSSTESSSERRRLPG